jgi:WD40 repeat protein
LCAKFDPNTLTVITPHGNKVKVWNILDGDIKLIYSSITVNEITAFILDGYFKRMIVGDSSGETKVFNVLNGAFLKHLPKHQAEITCILCVNIPEAKRFYIVTGGMDNKINVCSDDKLNSSEILKTYQLNEQFATNIAFETFNSFLIFGTNVGHIVFWEIDTGKTNGIYVP